MAAMTPLTYDVLLALADDARHGYGIIKEIEDRSPSPAPSTGALYLALQRMKADGLIEEADSSDPDADARRRYYRLTVLGRERAEFESQRLEGLVAAARQKKLITGTAS